MTEKFFPLFDLTVLNEERKEGIEFDCDVAIRIDKNHGGAHVSGSKAAIGRAKKKINALLHSQASRTKKARNARTPEQDSRPSGKAFSPKNERQRSLYAAFDEADLVFALGPAGTGKTFVAVSKAVALLSAKKTSKIFLCRPAVEACGERIGFLPGKIEQKMDPFMQPVYDSMRVYFSDATIQQMIKNKTVEIATLGHMRGRTLKDCFVVLDEAQNASESQMTMILTRMGENCKMAVCGDESQSDVKDSGLRQEAMLHRDDPEVRVVEFLLEDVVRRPLVMRILRRKEDQKLRASVSSPA